MFSFSVVAAYSFWYINTAYTTRNIHLMHLAWQHILQIFTCFSISLPVSVKNLLNNGQYDDSTTTRTVKKILTCFSSFITRINSLSTLLHGCTVWSKSLCVPYVCTVIIRCTETFRSACRITLKLFQMHTC
jgi:hypothetical protein